MNFKQLHRIEHILGYMRTSRQILENSGVNYNSNIILTGQCKISKVRWRARRLAGNRRFVDFWCSKRPNNKNNMLWGSSVRVSSTTIVISLIFSFWRKLKKYMGIFLWISLRSPMWIETSSPSKPNDASLLNTNKRYLSLITSC